MCALGHQTASGTADKTQQITPTERPPEGPQVQTSMRLSSLVLQPWRLETRLLKGTYGKICLVGFLGLAGGAPLRWEADSSERP